MIFMLSREEALRAIRDLNFWGKDQDTGILRSDYVDTIVGLKAMEETTVLTGVRRGGKTTIAKQFLGHVIKQGAKKEQTLYVNFDEPIFNPYLNLELMDTIYEAYRERINIDQMAYIVFDEIQNISAWEKWVRSRQEKEKVKIIVSGSSSKLLSSEFSTALSGRNIQMDIYPLSFPEFVSFKGNGIEKGKEFLEKRKLSSLLRQYVEFGGFPKVVLEAKDKKEMLLKEYFNGIILRDVAARYNIKETDTLKALATILCTYASNSVSIGKLANLLSESFKHKTSLETISNYMHYMESAFFVFFVPVFSFRIKDQMKYPKKVYCIDCGLRNTVSFRFKEDLGRLYENAVFLELKRNKKDMYYWKNEEGKEVDFILKEGLKVTKAIQVCYDIRDSETREREVSALVKCLEEFSLKEGLIITDEEEKEDRVEGKKIRYIPLWKWLFSSSEY